MRIDGSTLAVFREVERQRQSFAALHEPSPELRALIEQQESQRRFLEDLHEPPALREALAQHERQRQLVESIHSKIEDQQRILSDLLEGPGIKEALSRVPGIGSPGLFEQADRFRDELRGEVSEEVAAEATVVETPGVVEPDALGRLADEREAILTCLKRFGQVGIAGGYFGIPIPHVILGLLLVFLAIGEVADEILQKREA